MHINKPLCQHSEIKRICKWYRDGNCALNIGGNIAPCEKEMAYLRNAPTVDVVVEMVRCKDCENRVGEIDACGDIYCGLHRGWFDKNAFCSYGERRMNNDL